MAPNRCFRRPAQPDLIGEEWRDTDYFGYQVSNKGRVRRTTPGHGTWPGRIVVTPKDGGGYPKAHLYVNGVLHQVNTHRLVAKAFLGPPPTLCHEAAHNDGDKSNADVSNLRWATPRENRGDKKRHGTYLCGSRIPWTTLHERDVQTIRRLYAKGVIQRELAVRFGITQSAVSCIILRRTWRHI